MRSYHGRWSTVYIINCWTFYDTSHAYNSTKWLTISGWLKLYNDAFYLAGSYVFQNMENLWTTKVRLLIFHFSKCYPTSKLPSIISNKTIKSGATHTWWVEESQSASFKHDAETNTTEKITRVKYNFRFFWILGCQIRGLTLYISAVPRPLRTVKEYGLDGKDSIPTMPRRALSHTQPPVSWVLFSLR